MTANQKGHSPHEIVNADLEPKWLEPKSLLGAVFVFSGVRFVGATNQKDPELPLISRRMTPKLRFFRSVVQDRAS